MADQDVSFAIKGKICWVIVVAVLSALVSIGTMFSDISHLEKRIEIIETSQESNNAKLNAIYIIVARIEERLSFIQKTSK